jgi:hypothetical protein
MAQQIKYSPKQEQQLMTELWSSQIADNPLAFVMMVFPWGQKGTPLEGHDGPRQWQRKILSDMAAHIAANKGKINFEVLRLAVASGRGVGKSALMSWIVVWYLSTRVGATTLVSANGEAQLRTIAWPEITKWVSMSINSHWWETAATSIRPANWLAELVERDLKISPRAWAAEGRLWSKENPDAYAGLHNHIGVLLIFDEASGIEDSIYDVSQGFWTENTPHRFWFCFSNPRRNSGSFFECFNKKRAYWNTRQIDAREVEGTDKAIYDQIIDEYGPDSNQARVEIYGEFPLAEEGSFITTHLVDAAFKRAKHKEDSAPIIIGVDPARSGADSTVIVVRQGRDILAIERHHGDHTMETVGNIIDAIERYKPVMTCIDEGGLGAGILDRLLEQRYKVRGVNFAWKAKNQKAHLNKRAEMWSAMREWLKTASITEDRRLKDDLTGAKSLFTSSGAIQLESKKDMRSRGLASPDSADALCMTFAFPIFHREYVEKVTQRPVLDRNFATGGWMSH